MNHAADDGLIRSEQLGSIGVLEHPWVIRLANRAGVFMKDNHIIIDSQPGFICITVIMGNTSTAYCFVRARQGYGRCLMN
ncbi:hypothetical protein G6F68_021823 [Rhizopus microsporus]|nr:hypothetical protein G6F68_021823 [Rhizopus microsporus]